MKKSRQRKGLANERKESVSISLRIAKELFPEAKTAGVNDAAGVECNPDERGTVGERIAAIFSASLFAEIEIVRQGNYSKPYILGFTIGLLLSTEKVANGLAFTLEQKGQLRSRFASVIPAELTIRSRGNRTKWRETIVRQAQRLPLVGMQEFFNGMARGLGAVFASESQTSRGTSTTGVYQFFLEQDDLERVTVAELYQRAKEKMGSDFLHGTASFTQLCNRIGIRGGSKSEAY